MIEASRWKDLGEATLWDAAERAIASIYSRQLSGEQSNEYHEIE
jgi:hypothetical protein